MQKNLSYQLTRQYNLRQVYKLCRPKNALPPLLSLFLGYSLNSTRITVNILAASVSIIFLNFFATLQNDIADKTLDKFAGRKNLFLDGAITSDQLKTVAYGLAAISLALPLLINDKQVFLILLLYFGLAGSYNTLPFQFSRKPVSSILLLSFLFSTMPLIIGYYLAGGLVNARFLWLLIAGFCLRFTISILKDYKDYGPDKKFHKNTFLVAYGPVPVKRTSLILSCLGYLIFMVAIVGYIKIIPLTSALLALTGLISLYGLWLRAKLRVSTNSFSFNNKIFHRIINQQNVFEAGIILCLYF